MLKELKGMAEDIVCLYVEDDELTRARVSKTLGNIFGALLVACDGKEGLDTYQNKHIDLIVSDIQMPRMNGLEMARQVKANDRRVPIVVTTAFNDERYLIDAIEIGIDRYVLKPIELEKLFLTLHDVCRSIVERRRSEELKKQEIARNINIATSKVLLDAINLYPSPTVIYSHTGKVSAVNNAFVNLLGNERLERILGGQNLSDLFTVQAGFLMDLAQLDPVDKNRNRVLIKTANGSKVFLADSQILQSGNELPSIVYTLTDITRLEYERLKSWNLSNYLRDQNRSKLKEVVAEKPKEVAKKPLDPITQEEQAKLSRSYQHKTTALDYTKEVAGDILDELDELSEIESELAGYMDVFEDGGGTKNELQMIADRIERYASTVKELIEFEDLAFALSKLAQFLPSLDLNTINVRKLMLLLGSIRLDLVNWRYMIFVNKEAKDIHYLDSSLLSSCLQIEIDFGAKDAGDSEDNDLDLF